MPGAIVEDVAVQADGKVVAAGAVDAGTSASDSFVARFRPGGVRDPGFGSDGVVAPLARPGRPGRADRRRRRRRRRRSWPAGSRAAPAAVARPRPGSIGGDSSDPALAMTAEALGDLVTFTITATNPGADPAQDVNVTVAPPGDVAATALATAGGGCAGTACALGTLARRGDARRVTLLARAKAPGPLTASAQVTGATFDSNPGNNSASATGTRDRQPRRPPRPHQAAARRCACARGGSATCAAREAGRQDERGGERRRTHARDAPRPDQ